MSAKIREGKGVAAAAAGSAAGAGADQKPLGAVIKTAVFVQTRFNTPEAWAERMCTKVDGKWVHKFTCPKTISKSSWTTTLALGYPSNIKPIFTPFDMAPGKLGFYVELPKSS